MGFALVLSAVFGVLTSLSILSCTLAIYLSQSSIKASVFKLSLFCSGILYHISRILAWIFVFYPSLNTPSKFSSTWNNVSGILAYIFIGQIFISVISIFSIAFSGKILILKPVGNQWYFYAASGFHLVVQILGGLQVNENPFISDYITLAFFALYIIGLSLIMSMLLAWFMFNL